MKKTAENRYPHSATLFRFCKEALEIRYQGNIRVIDQDVGAILGYDPADCSHWKKGKKNIRALATLRSIAKHLSVDERLLIDIAAGKIGLEEAVFEFTGYGSFALAGRNLENLRKEFFKNPARWQQNGLMVSFEELFDVDRKAVNDVVEKVFVTGSFTEAPIHLREVYQVFPNIKLESDEYINESVQVVRDGEGSQLRTTVKYRGKEMRPYVRFLIARELFKFFIESGHEYGAVFSDSPKEVNDVRANLFAGLLLVPGQILHKEVDKIDSSLDLISQLAATFWVSKSLMNQRLRDFMENSG